MTSAYRERLYPSLEEVGGTRKHTRGKENAPVPPVKRAKLHETPLKAPADSAVAALQTQIEREYKIRDGATRLLQASKNTRHSMEASKGLFVSNAKILALMREIQQRKAESTEQVKTSDEKLKPCKSKIGISDIKIPLEWRELEHHKGKSDSSVHYGVFCLFKIGNQVMDSSSLVEVDRTTMDIILRDTVIFPESVDPDFTLEIEVYCSVPVEESSGKPSTPIKILKKLRSRPQDKVSGSPAPSSNVPSSPYTPNTPVVASSHRFVLAGHAHLTITDVSNSCRTYVLKRGAVGASGTASTGNETVLLPLWGQICCNLMAQPACANEIRRAGFINMQRMVSGLPDWTRLWSVVRQNHFRCWMSPEDVGRKMPTYHFDLTKTMSVESAPRLSIRRPNALILRDSKNEFFMAFESKEERSDWMETINQAILDLKVWQSSCEFTIPVPQSKFYTDSPTKQDKELETGSKSETTL